MKFLYNIFCGFHWISKYQYCGSEFSRYLQLADIHYALSQNCEKQLLASSCPSVCLSVRPHGTTLLRLGGYSKILYLSIFPKSVEEIQISLKSDKYNVYLHENPHTFLIISRSALLKMRNVSDKSCRENQNTHFMISYVSSKIVPFTRQYEIIPQSFRDQRWQYGACALHAGHNRLQTHTLKCNTYCFSTQQMLQQRSLMLR